MPASADFSVSKIGVYTVFSNAPGHTLEASALELLPLDTYDTEH